MHPEVRAYRMTVRLDASPVSRHPTTGALYTWGTAALVGVLDYSTEYGTREFRDEQETFDPDSMATLVGVSLTLDHPDPSIDEGLVTTSSVRELGHGTVLETTRQDDKLRVYVCIASADAIDAYNSGVRELSCGYRSRYVPGAGEWVDADGKAHAFTGRQTLIRYNHLALVPLARAGHEARFDAQRRPTMKLTIRKTIREIPKAWGDSIVADANAHKAAVEKGEVRRDAIETGTVMIDGTELVLPKPMIDALMAALGIGGTPAGPSGADPTLTDEAPTDTPTPPKEEQPRMDAKTKKLIDDAVSAAVASAVKEALPKAIATEVGTQVGARFDAIGNRERIARLASPMLGPKYDYAGANDEHQIAVDALVRHDAKCKDDVEALAKAARTGNERAAGRLEERLETANRVHLDARDGGGMSLALDIDAARRSEEGSGNGGGGGDGTRRDALAVDLVCDSRQRMLDRLHGKKPKDGAAA